MNFNLADITCTVNIHMQTVEKIITLKKLVAKLYSRMPLIGASWRRSAAAELAQDGSPEAVYILAEAVTHSKDERVHNIAMEALRQLTDQRCINTVCSVWASTRHAALSALLTEKSWVASNPVEVNVLSALKTDRIEQVLEGNADMVEPLVNACEDSDPAIARQARECLVKLQNAGIIDALCAQWAKSREPLLTQAMMQVGYVARKPKWVRVISALQAGKLDAIIKMKAGVVDPLLKACRDTDPNIARRARTCLVGLRNAKTIDKLYARPDIVEPLIQACHDPVPEIARHARKCLLHLQHPKVVKALYDRLEDAIKPLVQACEDDPTVVERAYPVIKWLVNSKHKELLYRLVVEHEYPVAREIVIAEGGAEFVDILLDASENTDTTIAERARKCLGQLKKPEACEALCGRLIERDYPLACEAAVAAQYAPGDPNQRALFYFITEQWEKYENLDFDQTLLKAEYEAADDPLKKRIGETAKRTGRVEWAEIIVGRQWENLTDEEWETTLTVLERNERWERIWQLAQEAQVIWSVKFLQLLKEVGWTPDNTEERKGFLELVQLSEGCTESPSEYIHSESSQTTLNTPLRSVRCLAISPDGRILASGKGHKDKIVRLWSLPDGKLLNTLGEHPGTVTCLAISPDGRFLASGSYKTIWLWRLPEGENVAMLRGHSNWLRSLVISPDGRLLVSGSQDHTIRLWRLSDGKLLKILEGHTDWVNCLVISSDGRLLASGSDDRTICLWRLPEGEYLKTLEGHTDGVERLAISSGRQVLFSGGNDVRLWQLPDGIMLNTLREHPHWLASFAVSPDGRMLAHWSSEKTVRLWSLECYSLLRYLSFKQIRVEDIHWGYDSLQDKDIADSERKWLEFTMALVHWNRRFDIEVEEAPRGIPLGEFDIEIDT